MTECKLPRRWKDDIMSRGTMPRWIGFLQRGKRWESIRSRTEKSPRILEILLSLPLWWLSREMERFRPSRIYLGSLLTEFNKLNRVSARTRTHTRTYTHAFVYEGSRRGRIIWDIKLWDIFSRVTLSGREIVKSVIFRGLVQWIWPAFALVSARSIIMEIITQFARVRG